MSLQPQKDCLATKINVGKWYLDGRICVSDGPSVAGVEEGNILGPGLDTPDPAELVLRLLVGDAVDREPVKESDEGLCRLSSSGLSGTILSSKHCYVMVK